MPSPLDAPTPEMSIDDIVDWLELSALFSEFELARVDDFLGSVTTQEEEAEENIGLRDSIRERLIEGIENEFTLREKDICSAYPFELSSDAEVVQLKKDWRESQYSFYIICLIATHVSGSHVLVRPPSGDILLKLRNRIFQIVATFGLAGLVSGPAFSVGWPRENSETIIQLLTRAAKAGGGFTVRNPPSPHTSPMEKDGGVDAIGWQLTAAPPPVNFYYAQTASGRNWPEKPVKIQATSFKNSYIQDLMTGNESHVTIIPFRILDDAFFNSQHLEHSSILERLRLPKYAASGLELSKTGVIVDHAHNIDDLREWIDEYMDHASNP